VFGRGGEEALALQRAGIPYDVVPGVSSAVAAAGAAGIPVTHRGIASAFLVASAHDEAVFASTIGALQPNGVTLVVLMGLGRSAQIACRLIDNGWSRGTPAALVVDATRPHQQVWRGTLDQLAADAVEIRGDGAGTIVIGDVVALQLAPVQAAAGSRPAARISRSAREARHVSR
jgi:siroheme synthase